MITGGEEFGFEFRVTTVDWSHRVNHMRRGQVSTRGDHRLASRQTVRIDRLPDFLALSENLGTTGAVDRAIDAAAAK